jgi:hypothetical protein
VAEQTGLGFAGLRRQSVRRDPPGAAPRRAAPVRRLANCRPVPNEAVRDIDLLRMSGMLDFHSCQRSQMLCMLCGRAVGGHVW